MSKKDYEPRELPGIPGNRRKSIQRLRVQICARLVYRLGTYIARNQELGQTMVAGELKQRASGASREILAATSLKHLATNVSDPLNLSGAWFHNQRDPAHGAFRSENVKSISGWTCR